MTKIDEYLLNTSEDVPIIKSSLENVNSLLKIGGYPQNTIIGLYGPSGGAKSIFCWQEAFFFLKQSDKNVLYLGTEGGEELYPQLWFGRWKERFGLDAKDLSRIYVLSIRDIQKILALHGYNIRINRHFSGKSELLTTGINYIKRTQEPLKGEYVSEIENFIIDKNIGMIIVDSITNPIDLELAGGGYLDFPTRAGIISKWLNSLHKICTRLNTLIITVHHHSFKPAAQPDLATLKDVPKIKGGEIVEYNLKIVMYLHNSPLGSDEEVPMLSELRRMYLVRFFDEPKWMRSVPLMINDTGIFDISEDELKEIRKSAEETKHRRKLMR